MGPRIDPCGTPLVMGNLSEMWWPNFTFLLPILPHLFLHFAFTTDAKISWGILNYLL